MFDVFTKTLKNLFDGHDEVKKIAVAVSGGADSMALLALTQRFCQDNKVQLLALTVDHGLRAESATEAAGVAAFCERNKITHQILQWTGEKPTTALQDTARQARRRLLCNACTQYNAPFLLLAHQADDQAETILMRLQRGTGLRGLLGMRMETEDEETGVTVLRPLLSMRRQALRDFCAQEKIAFIDDPSNDDTQFERVRVRKALQALPNLADGVIQTIARLEDCDETLDLLASEYLEEVLEPIDNQTVWLPDEFVQTHYPPIQLRILEGAMLEVMPDEATHHDIPLDGLERLRDMLVDHKFSGQTLAGVQIKPHKADGVNGLLFLRAPERKQK